MPFRADCRYRIVGIVCAANTMVAVKCLCATVYDDGNLSESGEVLRQSVARTSGMLSNTVGIPLLGKGLAISAGTLRWGA